MTVFSFRLRLREILALYSRRRILPDVMKWNVQICTSATPMLWSIIPAVPKERLPRRNYTSQCDALLRG